MSCRSDIAPRWPAGPLREVENQLTTLPLPRRQFGSSTGSSSRFSLANRKSFRGLPSAAAI
jgi:hypothetical protein